MRKIQLLLSTLVMLVVVNITATANYHVDFNTSIATSSPDFKVAKGWGHIVGTNNYDGYGPYYMSYSYDQTSGVGGTGTLLAYRQYAGDSGGGSVCQDILITPAVNGTVTLDIMASTGASNSNNAFVEVYAINVDGSLGDLLKTIKTEIPGYNSGNNTSWTTYELANLASEQKIGLRCQCVYIDNFTAEEVNIPVERTLMVTKVANLEGYEGTGGSTTYFEQQPDGTLKVQLKVTLQNTGDINLNPGDDNYTLTVASASYASGTKTYYDGASIAITEAIDAGETKDIDVDFYVPYTSGWKYWFVKENVSGTTSSSYRYTGTTAYEPKFVFRGKDSSSSSNLTTTQTFGLVNEATTKSYEIANTGTAPLTINSIEIPEGFYGSSPSVLERADDYNVDGAIWYAWTWNTTDGKWVAEVDGKFTGLKNNVIFVRMAPAAAGNPDWSYEWNRTGDLAVQAGKTYVIDSWNGGDGNLGGHWAAAVVAKGSKKIVDITIPGTQGNYSGNLNIKYLDKDAAEKTYTLAFTGTVLPAGTWAADFNGDNAVAYPAGSVAEAGINSDYQVDDGAYNYFIVGRSSGSYATDNNKFITPKLHATAGQQLTFDVKGVYGSSYYAKVYVSTDRKTWGEPVAYYTYSEKAGAEAISSSWVNKSITFDAEGDYYVAFSLYGTFAIDNIIGLTKVDVAHDLYIKSVSWPDASINSGAAQSKPSVDIIPLTTETADAYTVKYVCGETVLAEGTPEALTASANSSKKFDFNWTPEVVSTTVYENTKVVFDFGGGVTFETEGFDLTIVKEPKFHFVKTLPSSKWYEPSNYTTPITFGKTNTADKQTFYVNNWGTAPLTVKSIVMPEGFTVTPAGQFVVNAYDQTNEGIAAASQEVTITFSTTTPGKYSGNMVITYVDGNGDDQTFELGVSGTKLDPNKWYATFGTSSDASNYPAGSLAQANVSITTPSTDNGALVSSSSTKNLFITPKLATTGENVQFEAKVRSSYYTGSVKVYSITDNVAAAETTTNEEFEALTPTLLGEFTIGTDVTSFTTYSVEAPAGEYYLAFKIADAQVDEIYGMTVIPVEHDWMIASSNIPTDAMQNVATSASVNVLNLGLADEAEDSYEVNLYIDGEVAGTGTAVAIPMNHKLSDAGTQLTVPMQSPKAGTFPVYIEVKAGAYSVATEPVSVTFAEEVAKAEADMATNGTTYEVPLYLNYKNSESVTMYNADALAAAGISAGTKIKKITYKGYKTTDEQTTSFQVYYKWTDDQTLTQPETTYPFAAEDNGMTKLIDEDHTWAKVGSSSELGEMIVLDFTDSPLTYEAGKSLVIYMHSYVDGYKTAYFEKSTLSSDYCYTRKADAASLSASFSKATPAAIHFTLAVEPRTYSGTVKDNSGNAIENATVTLVSTDGDNIQYTGTTNALGEFTINVIQATREYNATASAIGYVDDTDNGIEFDDNKSKDFVLFEGVTVTVTSAEWATITTPATYAVNFDGSANFYIATAVDDVITLTKIDDAPANTPVVVNAPAGSYTMIKAPSADTDVSANKLKSSDGSIVGNYVDAEHVGDYYVLGMTGGQVGFGPLANGVTLAAGKAYIPATDFATGKEFYPFVIDDASDETTTINAVDAAGMDDDTPVYNLAGQKVGKDYKGVVIVNGKKVIRK